MKPGFEKISHTETDPRRSKFTAILSRNIKDSLNLLINENEARQIDQALYLESLSYLSNKLKTLKPEETTEIDEITSIIVNSDFKNSDEFGDYAAKLLSEFILKHFDYSEIESISREGKNMLNRLVEYEIDDEGDVIWLHIPITFVEDGAELRTLFVEALRELANRLKQDPNLQNITKIGAASWIIYRLSDRNLEALGFTNIERYETDHTGSAEIPRAVLLEKYN